jgi:DNA-binding CsgD family transcriptional regulator
MCYGALLIKQLLVDTLIDSKVISRQVLLEEAGHSSSGYCVEPVVEVTDKTAVEIAGWQEIANVFDAVSEAIVCYDSQLRVVRADQYICHLFNISNEQVNPKKCYELFYHKDTPCPGCPVIKTLQTGKEEEANLITPDGTQWLFHTYPLRDPSGCISGVIGKIKNISESAQSSKGRHHKIIEISNFKKLLSMLTEREREVMELVAEGCPNKVIGTKLGISPRTVEIHRGRLMTKLQVTSTAELVRYLTKLEIFGRFIAE